MRKCRANRHGREAAWAAAEGSRQAVVFQHGAITAKSGARNVMIVSGDAGALATMVRSVPQAPEITVVATASEARIAAGNKAFHAIIVDLRHGDASLALAIPQLADIHATANLVAIAPQSLAQTIAANPAVDSLLVAPFSTDTLVSKLKLDAAEAVVTRLVRPAVEADEPEQRGEAVRVLFFPARPDGIYLPDGAIAVDAAITRPDVIVLTQRAMARRLAAALPRAVASIVPIIDTTGANEAVADIALQTATREAVADAFAKLKPVVEKIRTLPQDLFLTEKDEDILLARLYVRGRGIEPAYKTDMASVVTTADSHVVHSLFQTADALADAGAFKKTFFDKLNCCPDCSSARVLLREECRKCRSSDIEEVSIVHHFRCGYQAPERDFVQGRELRCPKCMHTLEAFSVDYDRPGSLMICNGCNNETGEAAIGFKCVDCGANEDAARLKTRTHHRYELTETAERVLLASFTNRAASALPTSQPSAVIARFVGAMEAKQQAYSGILVRLDKSGAVRKEHGERALRGSMHLIERAMIEALAVDVEIVRFETSLLVLVQFGDAEQLRDAMPEVVDFARRMVALPIEVGCDVLSGPRLKQILVDPKSRRSGERADDIHI